MQAVVEYDKNGNISRVEVTGNGVCIGVNAAQQRDDKIGGQLVASIITDDKVASEAVELPVIDEEVNHGQA